MSYTRFAIYYLPPPGPLADFGAAWLGWDVDAGRPVDQADVAGLQAATATPRKYGFHATLKPPFALADGFDPGDLARATARMAASCAPAQCVGLQLHPMGRFLALTLAGEAADVGRVAATCVAELDRFRAPASAAEIERRRKPGLSPVQDALLDRWGYPYVMEAFRFHMTLTGRLPADQIGSWTDTLQLLLPPLPAPFVLNQVALIGERPDGRFELIQRHRLAG